MKVDLVPSQLIVETKAFPLMADLIYPFGNRNEMLELLSLYCIQAVVGIARKQWVMPQDIFNVCGKEFLMLLLVLKP